MYSSTSECSLILLIVEMATGLDDLVPLPLFLDLLADLDLVGACVGGVPPGSIPLVGEAVGFPDGLFDGLFDGDEVGEPVGATVGVLVGFFVGLVVGGTSDGAPELDGAALKLGDSEGHMEVLGATLVDGVWDGFCRMHSEGRVSWFASLHSLTRLQHSTNPIRMAPIDPDPAKAHAVSALHDLAKTL